MNYRRTPSVLPLNPSWSDPASGRKRSYSCCPGERKGDTAVEALRKAEEVTIDALGLQAFSGKEGGTIYCFKNLNSPDCEEGGENCSPTSSQKEKEKKGFIQADY